MQEKSLLVIKGAQLAVDLLLRHWMTITLEAVRELLNTQSTAYMNLFKIMYDKMKQEMRIIQNRNVKEKESQLEGIETRLSMTEERLSDAVKLVGGLENKFEYAENQSVRNSLKLIGVPESSVENTWDNTECVVKELVKEKLGTHEELRIERCHRVN